MLEARKKWSWAFAATLLSLVMVLRAESAIGVNWGSVSLHRLKLSAVVDLMKDNKISKVKFFNADPNSLRALMGNGIQVMVGIPNKMLAALSSSADAFDLWVHQNVSRYMVKNDANIRTLSILWNILTDTIAEERARGIF
ncbi:hypothetical protein ACFX12_035678 [Malus domestica]